MQVIARRQSVGGEASNETMNILVFLLFVFEFMQGLGSELVEDSAFPIREPEAFGYFFHRTPVDRISVTVCR